MSDEGESLQVIEEREKVESIYTTIKTHVYNDLRHMTIIDRRPHYFQALDIYEPNKIEISLENGKDLTETILDFKVAAAYLYARMTRKFLEGDKTQSNPAHADFCASYQQFQVLWYDLDTINNTIEVDSMERAIADSKFVQDFGTELLGLLKTVREDLEVEIRDLEIARLKKENEKLKKENTQLKRVDSTIISSGTDKTIDI